MILRLLFCLLVQKLNIKMNISYPNNKVIMADVKVVVWRKSSDQYLVEILKQFIQGLKIKVIDFDDILTLQEKCPIIYISTMGSASQSYDKPVYYQLAQRNLSNALFRIQVKNRNASYYDSIFEQITKITPIKSFILKLSIGIDCKLCFSTDQERQQCKQIFKEINNQIMNLSIVVQEQTNFEKVRIKRQLEELKYQLQLQRSRRNLKSNDSDKVFNLEYEKKQLQIRLSTANRHLEQKNDEIEILKKSQQRLKNKIIDLQNEQDKRKQICYGERYKKQQIIASMAEEKRKLIQTCENLSKQNKRINQLNINSEAKVRQLTNTINNLSQQKNSYLNKIIILEGQLQKLKNLQTTSYKQKQRHLSQKAKLNKTLVNYQQQNKKLREQIQMYKKYNQNLKNKQSQLATFIQHLKNKINVQEMNLSKTKESISILENKVIQKQKTIQDLLTKIFYTQTLVSTTKKWQSIKRNQNKSTHLQHEIKKQEEIQVPKQQIKQEKVQIHTQAAKQVKQVQIQGLNSSSKSTKFSNVDQKQIKMQSKNQNLKNKKIQKPWKLITNIPSSERICRQIHKYIQQNQINIDSKIYDLKNNIKFQKQDRIILLNFSNYQKKHNLDTNFMYNVSAEIKKTLSIIEIKQKLLVGKQKYKQNDYVLPGQTKKYVIQSIQSNKKSNQSMKQIHFSNEFKELVTKIKQGL